jgi:RNA-directed DNA polymerase
LSSHPESNIINTELHNQGTPQGGVISPLLANIALNGMEIVICHNNKRNIKVIRYADNVVVFSNKEKLITEAYKRLTEFLELRGLNLSLNKTSIGHTMCPTDNPKFNGLEYLGFNFRNVETSIHRGVKNTRGKKQKFKQITMPSRNSVQRHKANIKRVLKQYKNSPLGAVISRLAQIIRG